MHDQEVDSGTSPARSIVSGPSGEVGSGGTESGLPLGGNAFELWTLENFPSARGDDVDETVNAEERRGAVDHARSAAPDLLGTAASINREAPVLLVNEVIARQ